MQDEIQNVQLYIFIMNHKVLFLYLVVGLASAQVNKSSLTLKSKPNRRTVENRLGMYDGKNTTIEKHPYMVAILINVMFFCPGIIVSSNYVLTTGDCTANLEASELFVVAGSQDGSSGTTYTTKKIIQHPRYEFFNVDYNFALLQIKGSFFWSGTVAKINLPSNNPKTNDGLIVTGWNTSAGVQQAAQNNGCLRWINVPRNNEVACSSTCKKYYPKVNWTATMGCAYNKNKTTLCDEDFGDPFVKDNRVYALFSRGGSLGFCTSKALPVILSNVYSVVDWVKQYTG